MTHPHALAAALLAIDVAAAVLHQRASWRYRHAATRRRLYRLAWELRSLILMATVPVVTAMLVARLAIAFLPSVVLVQIAGLVAADIVAPAGLGWQS